MNFKDKHVCVHDSGGTFTSLAERLVRDFGKVSYMTEWEGGFADGRELLMGSGLPGVNRVKYFWKDVHQFDLIVFPDVCHADKQEFLRSNGMRVWGGGYGSELELARWKTHQRLPDLGLPQNKAVQIIGTDGLRKYLQEHENQFVKIPTFRGITETFRSENYILSKGKIDELDCRWGPMASILGFVVEEAIPDAREVGYDGYHVGGFAQIALYGVEKKNQAYFGKVVQYKDLPETVKTVNAGLSKAMPDYNYRQFISTEIREKDGNGYLIDITARHASPGGEVETEMFSNLADILWFGAEGQLVEPQIEQRFGAQLVLCSDWAREHPCPIQFDEALRPWVKLHNHCIVNGVDYTIQDNTKAPEVGSVVALGNKPEEAVKLCKERAERVHGFMLEYEEDALDEALKEMNEA